VPNLRTMVTEIGTGLGMLGLDSLDDVLAARPSAMRNLSPEDWDKLRAARAGGAFEAEFHAAWENGRAFLAARDGLRGRRPELIEWKGSVRGSGDEVAPVDLRIDHVYMVSCKYLSNILFNVSPAHLFDALLVGGPGRRTERGGGDWYMEVAPEPYARLYDTVRDAIVGDYPGTSGKPESPRRAATGALAPALPGLEGPVDSDHRGTTFKHSETLLRDLPSRVTDLTPAHRKALADRLKSGWPIGAKEAYAELADAVARASSLRWRAALGAGSGAGETMLWRLLRMGNAPYFVLGSTATQSLRLRIATPWDWRQSFTLVAFEIFPQLAGQPRVGWEARVRDRTTGQQLEVLGHIEVRWSHGRFGGPPEAKGYTDTRHGLVPGYFPLQ